MKDARGFETRILRFAEGLEAGLAGPVRGAAAELGTFLVRLRVVNRTTNLVSRGAAEPEELVSRHLADSLLGLRYLRPPRSGAAYRLLDFGSGGGFPAIPLLIVRRDIHGILVESVGKKCRFLEGATKEVGLTAEIVNARFPDSFQMRDFFPVDILTTRAVAGAGRLVRAARPLLGPGAQALLWTTEPLFRESLRESGFHKGHFHRSPDAASRGIGVLECST